MIADFKAPVRILVGRAKGRDCALCTGVNRSTVGHDTLGGKIAEQVKNVDIVVSVLVCIANGEVPSPEVSESFANAPCFLAASAVFDDGDVPRLSSRVTGIIGPEWIVALENHDVVGSVPSEFTDLDELNI